MRGLSAGKSYPTMTEGFFQVDPYDLRGHGVTTTRLRQGIFNPEMGFPDDGNNTPAYEPSAEEEWEEFMLEDYE